MPVRDATVSIPIEVVDPPAAVPVSAAKPNDEKAKFAFLISTIQVGEAWQLWIHDRTADRIHKLPVGATVAIGDFRAKVAAISDSGAELVWQGRPFRVDIGNSLAEGAGLGN